jgi:hypothetical protein
MKKQERHKTEDTKSGLKIMNDRIGTIKTCYKDDYGETILCKKYNHTSTISEIIKVNPRGSSKYSIEITIEGIKHLRNVELVLFYRKEHRLSFNMDIDELIPKSASKKKWQQVAVKLEPEIWKHDEKIMALLSTNELAVNWGGPDTKEVKASADILYYVDNKFSFIFFNRSYVDLIDIQNMNLKELREKAIRLSSIVDLIIKACKAK